MGPGRCLCGARLEVPEPSITAQLRIDIKPSFFTHLAGPKLLIVSAERKFGRGGGHPKGAQLRRAASVWRPLLDGPRGRVWRGRPHEPERAAERGERDSRSLPRQTASGMVRSGNPAPSSRYRCWPASLFHVKHCPPTLLGHRNTPRGRQNPRGALPGGALGLYSSGPHRSRTTRPHVSRHRDSQSEGWGR